MTDPVFTNRGRVGERTRLLAWGFQNVAAAETTLAKLPPELSQALGPMLGLTADPDQALGLLSELLQSSIGLELASALSSDEGTAMRLVTLLGASQALAEHLLRHPEQWRELADPDLGEERVDKEMLDRSFMNALTGVHLTGLAARDALRVEYRRWLLRIAARDLAHDSSIRTVGTELATLAGAALDAALLIASRELPESASQTRLAVIAMGKCGAEELNYLSDVDVIFGHVANVDIEEQTAARAASQLASRVIQICSEPTGEGALWDVDAALRPEGKSGPLSRTVPSHLAYYQRWAKTWEFQALLKARPIAGDVDLGRQYLDAISPLVWQAASRPDFVAEVQQMRHRVLQHIPAQEAGRQLKLGAGGLRDVEFATQLLQLVHGRSDESLRARDTLSALSALIEGGYVGRADGESLRQAYIFLRRLEHRLQLQRLRRSQVIPEDPERLRVLARAMGLRRDSVSALDAELADHRREVRRLHEKLFYRPLLGAVAKMSTEEVRLSPEAAVKRLAALGYEDPEAALRHIGALTRGLSRRAAIQRHLLPAMLDWFADAPNPDVGLMGFRRISDALGRTPWYLQTLRDEGEVAERLAKLLASSRYATDLLEREPEGVRLLGEPLVPKGSAELLTEMLALATRQGDAESAVAAIRGVRRRELLRIAAGDLAGVIDVEKVGQALAWLTDATLEATLQVASTATAGGEDPLARMAMVAMGRYGGLELSYGSDADVMFVYQPIAGVAGHRAAEFAHQVASEVRRLLLAPATDPPLEVDADLRPEGRQGPLVRTLASYRAYYDKWSEVWEAQALLRADPVVGDPGLKTAFAELINPLRYPEGGLSDDEVAQIRRLKARVDAERLPRGADPSTHLKLGRGGLADIEWTIQLLQLRHAAQIPELAVPQTLVALRAAGQAGLLTLTQETALVEAWLWVSRVRNALTLISGRPGDQLPSAPRDRAALARVLGYPPGSSEALVNDHLRATRHARAVVDEVFWGD